MIRRVLVVGLGSIGQRHLKILRAALPSADIRVLRRSKSNETVEFTQGCFASLEEACAFAPDIAVIANPAPFHTAVARALAETGAHLLVEKPISDNCDDVAELITLCNKRRQVLQVGYNLRFLESLQAFRNELTAERIGTVQAVRCEIGQYLPDWRPGSDYRTTVSAQRSLGGGVLLELSHELDMLRWVFGEVDWISAWSGRLSELDINVEDCAMLQMRFVSGAVAQLGMDFIRRDTTRTCTAIGSEGSLRWCAVAGRVEYFDLKIAAWKKVTQVTPDRDASYSAQISHLLAAVQGDHDHETQNIAAQGADGLAVMRLIEAARLSDAHHGKRVPLQELV